MGAARKERKKNAKKERISIEWINEAVLCWPARLPACMHNETGYVQRTFSFPFFFEIPRSLLAALDHQSPLLCQKSFSAAFQRANSMAAIKTWRRSQDGMDGWMDGSTNLTRLHTVQSVTMSSSFLVARYNLLSSFVWLIFFLLGSPKEVRTSAGPCVAICDGHCLEAY